MLDLNDFRLFVEVVDRGGFSAAGRALERPTSTVSYRIQQLERELGLTLFARTSRSVAMTPAGEEFYRHAISVIERARDAEVAMRDRSSEASGAVHYSVPVPLALFAMPDMLLSFMDRYPRVELVQHVSNEPVDIIADRYDLAIRAHSGPLPDSQLIQRPLADVPWHFFASPDYVSRTGLLTSPHDLAGRETLLMRRDKAEYELDARPEGDPQSIVKIRLKPRMVAACMVTIKHAAEAGRGIAALPAYIARPHVRAGRLQRVLPNWVAEDSKITALMPHRNGMTAATRSFVDHIAASFPPAVRSDD